MTNNFLCRNKNYIHYVDGKQRLIVTNPSKQKYTPLRYLQNDWTSYIIFTNLYPDTNTVIESVGRVIELGSAKAGRYAGSGSENGGSDCVDLFARIDTSTCGRFLGKAYTNGMIQLNKWHLWHIDYDRLTLDDVEMTGSGTPSGQSATNPMYLFRCPFSTNESFLTYGGIYQISSFRAWNKSTGEVLLDAIPVLDSNNVACMWDRAHDTLYYNQGSGTFSYGEWDYEEADYLALDETAWGSTNLYGNNNTSYDMIVKSTTYMPNSAPFFGARSSATANNIAGYMPGSNNLTSAIQDFGNYTITRQTITADFKYRYRFYNSKEKRIVHNADTHTVVTSTTTDTADCTTPRPMKIGVVDSGFNTGNKKFLGNIYMCKIWDGPVLVRDYTPVMFEGVGAFYDRRLNYMMFSSGATPFNPYVIDRYGEGHKLIEYAWSNGNDGVINTEYLPKQNTEIFCKFKFDAPLSRQSRLYGCTCPANGDNTGQLSMDLYINGSDIWGYSFGNQSDGRGSWQNFGINADTNIHTMKINKTKKQFDSTISNTNTGSFTGRENNTQPIYLFTTNLLGTGNIGESYLRIYKWTASENGIMKKYFLPVALSNGKAAMIDMVERKVHYNENDKLLPYIYVDSSGVQYKRLKNIISTGTEYFNTGVTPNQDNGVELYGDFINTAAHTRAGVRTNQGSKCFDLITDANNRFRLDAGTDTTTVSNTQWNPSTTNTRANQISYDGLSQNGQFIFANGTTERKHYTKASSFTCDSTYRIMNMYSIETAGDNLATQMPLTKFVMKSGLNTIKEYYPVMKSDGTIGLFNTVDSTFLANSGTGNFQYQDMDSMYVVYDYLTGSGTQYLDLGLKATSDDEIIIVAKKAASTTTRSLFGSRTSATDSFCIAQIGSTGMYNVYFSTGNDYNTYAASASSDITDWVRLTMSKSLREIYNLDTSTAIVSNSASMNLEFTTPQNCYLFCASGSPWTSNKWSGSVKSLKWRRNGTLLRDMIPVVRVLDNKPGMYDRVNNVFYTNAGTGEFTYG